MHKTSSDLMWEIINAGRDPRDSCKIASLCTEFWYTTAQELQEEDQMEEQERNRTRGMPR